MSDAANDAIRTLDRCNAKLRWCIWLTVGAIAVNVVQVMLLCRIDAVLSALPP